MSDWDRFGTVFIDLNRYPSVTPMTSNHIAFNKKNIEQLPTPAAGAGRVTYIDQNTPGLQIRVTPRGIKSFSFHRRVRRKAAVRVTIGRFPEITVAYAKEVALNLAAQTARGEDPTAASRADKASLTFADLFARYIDEHSKLHKRTWNEDQAKFDKHLSKPLGKVKVHEVSRAEVAAVHAKISQEAPVAANRVLALVSHVFNWGQSRDLCASNPAENIQRNNEQSRDRFLKESEMKSFLDALSAEPDETIRDFFMTSLLTAARRSNVLAMRWEDIDLPQAVWRIPMTKNGEPQSVPLSTQMLELLGRRKVTAQSPWVFPGVGKTGHYADPKKAWAAICERSGLKNLRIHDLRRTNASWQVMTGANLAVIGKSLNHKSPQSTSTYARSDLGPVRESQQKAVNAMLKLGAAVQA
jgi:integrase